MRCRYSRERLGIGENFTLSLERSKTVKRLEEMRTVPEAEDIVLFHTSAKSCSGFGINVETREHLCKHPCARMCLYTRVRASFYVGVGGCWWMC